MARSGESTKLSVTEPRDGDKAVEPKSSGSVRSDESSPSLHAHRAIASLHGTLALNDLATPAGRRRQAAATAGRHVVIATARSARCVWAETRWRWTLKVLSTTA